MTEKRGNPNPGRVQRVQNLRRSNASGTQSDRRTKKNRTKTAQRRNAIHDQLKH